MKIRPLFLLLGCIIGVSSYAQSYDPRVEKAMRAQKKAMEAQIMANKAERAKAMSMGKKTKNTGPVLTDPEKAKRNKENMDRIRKRMQFLQNNANNTNPEAKYRAGPGGAAIREGAPGYKSPSNNVERKEARVAQTYPKRY
ncbi:hypothetical protein [Sediminibacterium sp.]|uniref:hypothetical protein n=1 Tax=Sediminibacterium sp. TaxID=1917865 RepID=UPI0027212257|nr:hypothetical protein [Sediminibacterium sp.]MDO9155824.1 hypothetical protein [Sediminibacterium sp.]MDP1973193.1 hypothetical protein [Sediminibacterium sp.]MDP2420366.1 hypothetical protein [Sediminibacterium sp.]